MTYLAAFVASMLYIGLKAIQQRQVMHAEYRKMPAVSILMAFCEVFIVVNVVRTSESVAGLIWLALAIGSGAAIGSMLGTYYHVRSADRRHGA